ncbi:MAG TPA: cupin domain-containing protein [Terriglobia bacterium]|nr:cupin domain-containing protein [Terriglobia bacterium]
MEFSRREALISAFIPLLQAAVGSAQGQQPQTAPSTTVFVHELPNLTMDGWEVNASTITMAPGSSSSAHHHPGFVLVYVLEGDIITKISGQEQKTYSAGQMFYEQPGSTHEVSRNASATKPAKFLALIFAKKGAQLVTPA